MANGMALTPEPRPVRHSRRAMSYYNPFQTSCSAATDDPPSYATTVRQKPTQQNVLANGREVLPKYTCSVAAEAKLNLNIESVNPLHGVSPSEWREIYLVLRGTLLSFHKAKDDGPGRLLRSYTLQHAEVGLATDLQHSILVPRTRLAHLVPVAARPKAWQKDQKMFELVRQHTLRLRLETDQIVLAASCEEQIYSLINAIGAGIDLACSIDERSIPRQCTVPRRRRRQRPSPPTDLADPALLAEQERILRSMYPEFADRAIDQPRFGLGRTVTTITGGNVIDSQPEAVELLEPPASPGREEDEIDFSAIREDPVVRTSSRHGGTSHRPSAVRVTTDASMITTYSGDMMYATASENFDPSSGKWQPPHTRTAQQIQRYVKRCTPTLLAEAPRASDILICNGKRVKVNWRMELLEEWELQPPSYKSHGFSKTMDVGRRRSISQHSVSGSGPQDNAQTSTSVLGVESDEQITRVESGFASLALTKVSSVPAADKISSREAIGIKGPERRPVTDVHGVVFCF